MKIPAYILALLLIAPALGFAGGAGYVALQTADPACDDDSGNTYVDCGNGTVTDNRTKLIWLKDAGCLGSPETPRTTDWFVATHFAANLSDLDDGFCDEWASNSNSCDCDLADNSSPGEWRLPTIDELNFMISDAIGDEGDPNCIPTPPTITNDSGGGCWISGPSSFINIRQCSYWSSSLNAGTATGAWRQSLCTPLEVDFDTIFFDGHFAWPVRGGQ